jgi:hypothetical protein
VADGRAVAQADNHRLLIRTPGFAPRAVLVGFVVDRVALGQAFLRALRFSLSVSFHRCSIFTHVSSGGWTMGPLEAQFYRDIVSLYCNSNNNSHVADGVQSFETFCMKKLSVA